MTIVKLLRSQKLKQIFDYVGGGEGSGSPILELFKHQLCPILKTYYEKKKVQYLNNFDYILKYLGYIQLNKIYYLN